MPIYDLTHVYIIPLRR